MATTIVTKSGSGAPAASDLVAGELAVDLTNGRLYTEDSGGTVLELGLNPNGNVNVTGNVGIGVTPTMPLDVAGACSDGGNTGANVNQTLYDTTSYALGVGGGIGFAGKAGSGSNLFDVMFATINGIKENATNANYSSALTFKTRVSGSGLTERMRISSAGNVGIGVSDPKRVLVLGKGDSTGVQTQYTNSTTGVAIGDGFTVGIDGSENAEFWNYGNTNMLFATNGTERMRIDSSGTLLVGTTDSTPYNNSGTGNGGAGIQGDGLISAAREDFPPAIFNRLVSDGNIVEFRKDGTTVVGSIGNNVNNLTVDGLNAVELRQGGATRAYVHSSGLHPWDNATYSLGTASSKWSDLYLSGGVYLGGTVAANKLDYYEEGTWDPEIYYQNATDQAAATDVIQTGTYTKVGNIVNVSFRLEWTAGTGLANDNIGVKNLPFLGASSHYNSVGTFFSTYTGSDSVSLGNISAGGSLALILDAGNSGNLGPAFGTGTGRYIRGSMTYQAA